METSIANETNVAFFITTGLSVAALIIALLAWRAAEKSTRASIYDQRFEVHEDTMKFVRAWTRHGQPDMDLLPMLVGAWERSHFLFGSDVTTHIRLIWTDAVKARYASDEMTDQKGDKRQESVRTKWNFFEKHATDYEVHRKIFTRYLKID